MFGQGNRLGMLAGCGAVLAVLTLGFIAGCEKKDAAEDANAPASPKAKATDTSKAAGPAASGTRGGSGAAAAPAVVPMGPAPTPAGEEAAPAATTPVGVSEADIKAAEREVASALAEAAKKAGAKADNAVLVTLKTSVAKMMAVQEASAFRASAQNRAKFVEVAARAMKAGALSDADKATIKAMAAAAPPPAAKTPAQGTATRVRYGLPQTEAEKATRIQKFASFYGPVTWVREKDWNGTIIEWVTLTFNHQRLKVPLALIMDAPRLKMLEPYFRMYPDTGFSKVISKQQMTGSASLKALVLQEEATAEKAAQQQAQEQAKVAAAAQEQAKAAATAAAPSSGERRQLAGRRRMRESE